MDTRGSAGQGFVRRQMMLCNEVVFALRAQPVRPGVILAKFLKMYRNAQAYQTEHGRKTIDENLDALARFLYECAREFVAG